MGINPITYQEIEAYSRLTGSALSVFDVAAIKRLDGVAIKESNREK